MRVNAMTDVGRVRSENQDNYRVGVLPHNAAWGVVCDGMGGGYDGNLAATLAVDTIGEKLVEKLEGATPDGVRDLLLQGIEQANASVFIKSGSGERVMGTTAVCAVMQDDILHLAHVGDSRAYMYSDGALTQLTKDHSVVQELIDQGRISAEEAVRHPEKNVITRALGVDNMVEADYLTFALNPDEILMICTDGLTNMVTDARMIEILQTTDFYSLAKELVAEALLCGGADNVTVLLMQSGKEDDDA